MAKLIPVEGNPFEQPKPKLIPVEGNPFEQPSLTEEVKRAIYSGLAKAAEAYADFAKWSHLNDAVNAVTGLDVDPSAYWRQFQQENAPQTTVGKVASGAIGLLGESPMFLPGGAVGGAAAGMVRAAPTIARALEAAGSFGGEALLRGQDAGEIGRQAVVGAATGGAGALAGKALANASKPVAEAGKTLAEAAGLLGAEAAVHGLPVTPQSIGETLGTLAALKLAHGALNKATNSKPAPTVEEQLYDETTGEPVGKTAQKVVPEAPVSPKPLGLPAPETVFAAGRDGVKPVADNPQLRAEYEKRLRELGLGEVQNAKVGRAPVAEVVEPQAEVGVIVGEAKPLPEADKEVIARFDAQNQAQEPVKSPETPVQAVDVAEQPQTKEKPSAPKKEPWQMTRDEYDRAIGDIIRHGEMEAERLTDAVNAHNGKAAQLKLEKGKLAKLQRIFAANQMPSEKLRRQIAEQEAKVKRILNELDSLPSFRDKFAVEHLAMADKVESDYPHLIEHGAVRVNRDNVESGSPAITVIGHKDIVKRAMREGKPVPAEVLKDYPDFAQSASANEQSKPEPVEQAQTADVATLQDEYKRLADIRYRIKSREISTKDGLREAGVRRRIDLDRRLAEIRKQIEGAKSSPVEATGVAADNGNSIETHKPSSKLDRLTSEHASFALDHTYKAAKPKYIVKTIAIPTTKGHQDVKAEVIGDFAVHKALGGGGYVVTHVPSGKVAFRSDTKKSAKKAAWAASETIPAGLNERQILDYYKDHQPLFEGINAIAQDTASGRDVVAKYLADKGKLAAPDNGVYVNRVRAGVFQIAAPGVGQETISVLPRGLGGFGLFRAGDNKPFAILGSQRDAEAAVEQIANAARIENGELKLDTSAVRDESKGLPMSEYRQTYRPSQALSNKVYIGHGLVSDSHVLYRGDVPRGYRGNITEMNKNQASLINVPEGDLSAPLETVGFDHEAVFLQDGTAIARKYFDLLNKLFPGATIHHTAGDPVVWVRNGRVEGLVMPYRQTPPERIKVIIDGNDEARPAVKGHGIEQPRPDNVRSNQDNGEIKPAVENFKSDIPADLATRAYAGSSFEPEKAGARERETYAQNLKSAWDHFAKLANTPEKKAILEQEFLRYREGMRKRTIAYLEALSRTMSPMITGPAKFPTARNEKRLATVDRRYKELKDYHEKATRAIERKLTPERAPIRSGEADTIQRLEAKLAKLEALQERMKAANRAIRMKDKAKGDAKLRELGFSDEQIEKLRTPGFGGVGFPSFELRNNNAEIRRLKQRIAAERNRPKTSAEHEVSGVRVIEDVEANRLKIEFPGKPDPDIIAELKRRGFRWSPRNKAWQRQLTNNARYAAQEILRKINGFEHKDVGQADDARSNQADAKPERAAKETDKGIALYSKGARGGTTADAVRASIRKTFGKAVDALERKGKLEIVQDESGLPENAQKMKSIQDEYGGDVWVDCLGNLAPSVVVSGYKFAGEISWYAASTAENMPSYLRGKFRSWADLRNALLKAGFENLPEDIGDPGYLSITRRFDHPATLKAVKDYEEKHKNDLEGSKPVFVRFGGIPKNERSKNHVDGTYEKGVSVFNARELKDGSIKIDYSHNQELGTLLNIFHERQHDIFVVEGDVVGRGSDGEPVLRNVRVVRKVDAPRVRFSKDGRIHGAYDPATGKVYLVAGNMRTEDAPGVLAHEFMHDFTASEQGRKVLDELRAMEERAKAGSPLAKWFEEARARVPEDTPEADRLHEIAAYAVQRVMAGREKLATIRKWVGNLLAKVKAFLIRKGWPAGRLDDKTLAEVAVQHLKAAAKDKTEAPIRETAASDVLYSRAATEELRAGLREAAKGRADGAAHVVGWLGRHLYFKPVQVIRKATPTARTLADMIYREAYDKGAADDLIARRQKAEGEYIHRLDAILEPLRGRFGLKKEDAEAIVARLNGRKPGVPKHLIGPAREIRKLLDDLLQYQRDAGVEIGEIDNYFPRFYDTRALMMHKGKFIELLKKHGYQNAEDIWARIVHRDGAPLGHEPAEESARIEIDKDGVPFERRPMATGGPRRMAHEKSRRLDIPYEELAPFLIHDLEAVLGRYVHHAVTRAEYARAFGKGEGRLNDMVRKIIEEYDENPPKGVTKQELVDTIYGLADSLQGRRPGTGSPRLDAFLKSVANVETMIHLPLVMFSSLPETLTTLSQAGVRQYARGVATALADATREATSAAWRVMAGKRLDKSEAREWAEKMGIIIPDAINGAFMARYGAYTGRMTHRFMRMTMLEQLTNMQRIVTTDAFKRMWQEIAETKNARKRSAWLKHYGLTDAELREWVDAGQPPEGPVARVIARQVQQVITTPNEAQIPLALQHPAWNLVFQFKRFTTVFSNTFLKSLAQRVKLEKEAGTLPAYVARVTMMVAFSTVVAFWAQYLRDAIKYSPEERRRWLHRDLHDWKGRMLDAFDRAGWTGDLTAYYQFFNPYRFGGYRSGAERLFNTQGPLASDVARTLDIGHIVSGKKPEKASHRIATMVPVVNAAYPLRKGLEKKLQELLR